MGGSSGVLRGQKPCDNFFVVKKLRRLLRLLRLLGQFGPDSLPVVREQLLPRYESASRGFDGCAVRYRNRAGSICPSADVGRVGANSFRQRRLAAAFLREVGFDVHRRTV